jgi:hypothetical protein
VNPKQKFVSFIATIHKKCNYFEKQKKYLKKQWVCWWWCLTLNLKGPNKCQRLVKKSNWALLALQLIKHHLTPCNTRTLLICNYYQVLYYNFEIWQGPHLHRNSKQQLMSASANAIESWMSNPFISFEYFHKIFTFMPRSLFFILYSGAHIRWTCHSYRW